MITVALEDIYAATILSFCENLAELGCPQNAEPDMWFRHLSPKEQRKIASKLIDIEERDYKRFAAEEKKSMKFKKSKKT